MSSTKRSSWTAGLIVKHLTKGDFGEVSREAAHQLGRTDARCALQGVDENIGLWRPSEETLKLGNSSCSTQRTGKGKASAGAGPKPGRPIQLPAETPLSIAISAPVIERAPG